MNVMTRTVLSFSLLAFLGAAYAQGSSQAEKAQPQQSQQTQQAQPQQGAEQSQNASAGASGQSQNQLTARGLMKAKVVDQQGKDLGQVDDVVIDLQKDRVHAVVVGFGGFMGVGEKQYAFPMNDLKPAKNQGQFTINVDKQKLQNAEGFAKGQYPGMDDQFWSRVGGPSASSGGAQQQGGQQAQRFNLVRASKLMGAEIQDKSGKAVGELRDVTLGSNGDIQHLLIDVKEGGGQARVPSKGLSSGTGERLVLDMTADQVRAQAKKSDRRAAGDQPAAAGGSTAPRIGAGQDRNVAQPVPPQPGGGASQQQK